MGYGPAVGSIPASRPVDTTLVAPTPAVNRPGGDRPPPAPQNASSKPRDNPLPRDPDLPSSQDMVSPERRLHQSQEQVDVSHSDTGNESSDADESDSTSRMIRTDDSHPAGHRVELNKRLGVILSILRINSQRLCLNLTQRGGGAVRKKSIVKSSWWIYIISLNVNGWRDQKSDG